MLMFSKTIWFLILAIFEIIFFLMAIVFFLFVFAMIVWLICVLFNLEKPNWVKDLFMIFDK